MRLKEKRKWAWRVRGSLNGWIDWRISKGRFEEVCRVLGKGFKKKYFDVFIDELLV